MNWKEFANNMKEQEKVFSSIKVENSKPIVLRLDMRSGGSFVKGLNKPFDEFFTMAMEDTAKALAEQIQGTQIVYVGSDEITLVLYNFNKELTPFFEGKLEKIISLASSIATLEFNKSWNLIINDFIHDISLADNYSLEYSKTIESNLFKAQFDSRAFNVLDNDHKLEVLKNIWWRSTDVSRNSIQMLARYYFSHKELLKKSSKEMKVKLQEIGHNWEEEVKDENKYGVLFIREAFLGEGYNPKTKETIQCTRHGWFKQDSSLLVDLLSCDTEDDFKNSKLYKKLFEE